MDLSAPARSNRSFAITQVTRCCQLQCKGQVETLKVLIDNAGGLFRISPLIQILCPMSIEELSGIVEETQIVPNPCGKNILKVIVKGIATVVRVAERGDWPTLEKSKPKNH